MIGAATQFATQLSHFLAGSFSFFSFGVIGSFIHSKDHCYFFMSIESVTPAPALCMCVSKGHLHDDDTTEAQSYTCNNHLELILSVASAIIKFIYCVILAADF